MKQIVNEAKRDPYYNLFERVTVELIESGTLDRGLRKELAFCTKRGGVPTSPTEVREREAELLARYGVP